jgi:integrase
MTRPKAFTDRYLATLKPAAGRYDVFDGSRRGLTLRVFPTGTKTFVFRYQRAGRPARITMGNYPAMTLRSAHEAHAELTKRLNRGEDLRTSPRPLDSSTADVATASLPALTIGDLADEFLKRFVYRERKRPEEAEQILRANILKPWQHRPVKDITRRDAIVLLDKIVDRGSPVMANRVGALLSQMFRFGVERGILDGSPLIALPRPGGTEKKRARILSEGEIRLVWRKLRTPGITPLLRLALKLILVTAQRPGEVAGAARCEFDLERQLWTIPPERSKNGQRHEVPLSSLALSVLAHLRRITGETEFIIPTRLWRQKGPAPITVRALSQALRDQAAHFGLPHFTPHDLRRTAASLMTAAGVPRLHVEKVLNHTIDDVAEIYDRHDYAAEKRAALETCGNRLMEILRRRPAQVVPLRRPARLRRTG